MTSSQKHPPRKHTAHNRALATELKKTNLYLVGMMGAGKTTIGRKLANRLGYRFLDTDALIEQSTGKAVTALFESEGEAAFREIETQVLSQVTTHTSLVVATGGGIVTQQMNWSYLHHGVVIWLDVPVPVIASRLSGDSSRPLLQGVDLSTKLTELLTARQRQYAQADIRIGYEGRSMGKTCDRILTAIENRLRTDSIADREAAVSQIEINQTSINPVISDAAPE
ncbi:MAG: shikimate kinase [Cyanobacteria bacterium J06627_28]